MTRRALCHFADDVRFELGSKVSVIGMYSGEMVVPTLPVALPQLVAMGTCFTPIDLPIKSLSFRVLLGDQVLQDGEIPPDTLRTTQAQVDVGGDGDDSVQEVSIGIQVALAPLYLESLAPLRMVMIADGVELVAGRLRIRQASE